MLTEDPEEWEIRIRSTYTSTLVLWGSNDRTLPLDLGNRLARELPNAQFFVIEGAGHMPNQDRPQDVLKHITTFLQAA
jgi:pimeloyl-ACP methyl ester carboxylesterase